MTNVISKYQTSLTILKSKLTTCMQTNLKRLYLLLNDLESGLIEVICCKSWLQTPDKYKTTVSSSDYLPLPALITWSLCHIHISAQALTMITIRPNFHIWALLVVHGTRFSYLGPNFHIWALMLVVPGTRWRWMRHGPVGSNGNQLTPKSFSSPSSSSLSSSSSTHSSCLLLNQRGG